MARKLQRVSRKVPAGLSVRRQGPSQPPRTRAFFLEFLLNMLIFALCAVVALQVFVEGKVTADESAAMSELALEAKDLAERFKASGGDLNALSLEAEKMELGEFSEDGVLTFFYDNNLELSSGDEARYRLVLTPFLSEAASLKSMEIAAFQSRGGSPAAVSAPAPSSANELEAVTSSDSGEESQLFAFEVSAYQPSEGR